MNRHHHTDTEHPSASRTQRSAGTQSRATPTPRLPSLPVPRVYVEYGNSVVYEVEERVRTRPRTNTTDNNSYARGHSSNTSSVSTSGTYSITELIALLSAACAAHTRATDDREHISWTICRHSSERHASRPFYGVIIAPASAQERAKMGNDSSAWFLLAQTIRYPTRVDAMRDLLNVLETTNHREFGNRNSRRRGVPWSGRGGAEFAEGDEQGASARDPAPAYASRDPAA